MAQGNSRIARTGSVFRYGSTVGEQLQALAIRPGRSFSAGLRLRPKSLGISFSDLKKKVCKRLYMQSDGVCNCALRTDRLYQHVCSLDMLCIMQIMPHGEVFDASTYLTRLHQVSANGFPSSVCICSSSI